MKPAYSLMRLRNKRTSTKLGLAMISLLVALLIAELVVRLGGYDWNFIEKMVYYQTVKLGVHQVDYDPQVMYRLKPSDPTDNDYNIHINDFGERGPDRKKEKPAGVYRIICVGGSNVWGANLEDHETWPAQLELKLNETLPGKYEVWNFGTSAYVGSQMVVLAREAIERYDPDLVFFCLSNQGWRAFLEGSPVAPFFRRHPELWEYYFTSEYLTSPSWLPYETNIKAIKYSSLYRLGILWYMVERQQIRPSTLMWHESMNVDISRKFFRQYQTQVPIVIFVSPAYEKSTFVKYYQDLYIPVLWLNPEGRNEDYHENHPPAYVMPWYAENITKWLVENEFVPPARASGNP